MEKISIALICRDEAANLPAWLSAVTPVADEVVAVDSGSNDDTVSILREAGVKVEHRRWSGYADQRNFAAGLCTGDWILFLDADERPDAELIAALRRLKSGPPAPEDAFELAYKVFFFGRFLRFGGFFPEYHLRLYRRGRGQWERREVHERLAVKGPKGRLNGYVEHYSYATVAQYLSRLEVYSQEAAQEMWAAGRRATGLTACAHATWNFLNRYILRLGFLDGYQGYLAARLESLYTLSKYARLRELSLGEVKDS